MSRLAAETAVFVDRLEAPARSEAAATAVTTAGSFAAGTWVADTRAEDNRAVDNLAVERRTEAVGSPAAAIGTVEAELATTAEWLGTVRGSEAVSGR